jgi:hypothetical protein
MKISEVKVGGIYSTEVSGQQVAVRVLAERTPYMYRFEIERGTRKPRRFLVQRVDNGQTLPKTRTAAALRPLPPRFEVYESQATNGWAVLDTLNQRRRIHWSAVREDAERVCASLNATAEDAPIAQCAAEALR